MNKLLGALMSAQSHDILITTTQLAVSFLVHNSTFKRFSSALKRQKKLKRAFNNFWKSCCAIWENSDLIVECLLSDSTSSLMEFRNCVYFCTRLLCDKKVIFRYLLTNDKTNENKFFDHLSFIPITFKTKVQSELIYKFFTVNFRLYTSSKIVFSATCFVWVSM